MSAPSVRPCARSGAVIDETGAMPSSSSVCTRSAVPGVHRGRAGRSRPGARRDPCGSPRRRRSSPPCPPAAAAARPDPLRRVGVDVGDADVADAAVLEQIDAAPVGEPRNREPDEILERRREVERLGQHLAGLGEERERLLASPVLGQVEERRHRRDDPAVGVPHRLRADRDDPERSVCPAQHELGVADGRALEREAHGRHVRRARLGRAGASQDLLRARVREHLAARTAPLRSRPRAAAGGRGRSGARARPAPPGGARRCRSRARRGARAARRARRPRGRRRARVSSRT